MLEEIKKEFELTEKQINQLENLLIMFHADDTLYNNEEYHKKKKAIFILVNRFIEQKLTEAIKQAKIEENERPKIITIIGSTRYINEMSLIGWEFEKQGHIVLNPRLLPPTYIRKPNDDGRHAAESENVKEIIDKTYLHKVAMADEIFVVNINGYIGESTCNELNHAIKLNKKIVWLEPESTN